MDRCWSIDLLVGSLLTLLVVWGRIGFDRVTRGRGGVSRLSGGLVKHLTKTLNANSSQLRMAA